MDETTETTSSNESFSVTEPDMSFALLSEAIAAEDELFSDMLLVDHPALLEVFHDRGMGNPYSIEHANFSVSEHTDDTNGSYDRHSRTITVALPYEQTTLYHEMIHYYIDMLQRPNPTIEEEPTRRDISICELLTVTLWNRLIGPIPDLPQITEFFLERVGHLDLENEGGIHDLLFLLKSFDIDLRLGLQLGYTFGYGMADEIAALLG